MKKLSLVPPVSLLAVTVVLFASCSGTLIPQYVKETSFMLGIINGAVLGTLAAAVSSYSRLRKEKKLNDLLKKDVAALNAEICARNMEDKDLTQKVSDLTLALTRMLDKYDLLKEKYISEKNKTNKLNEHIRKCRRKIKMLDPKVTGNFVVNSSGHVEKRLVQERLAS